MFPLQVRAAVVKDGVVTMIEAERAAIMALQQAAYDYGQDLSGAVTPRNWEGEGVAFMPWVGKMDLDSREVFAGDFVEVFGPPINTAGERMLMGRGVVVWRDNALEYAVMQMDPDTRGRTLKLYADGSVIPVRVLGNQHEHPELIK